MQDKIIEFILWCMAMYVIFGIAIMFIEQFMDWLVEKIEKWDKKHGK